MLHDGGHTLNRPRLAAMTHDYGRSGTQEFAGSDDLDIARPRCKSDPTRLAVRPVKAQNENMRGSDNDRKIANCCLDRKKRGWPVEGRFAGHHQLDWAPQVRGSGCEQVKSPLPELAVCIALDEQEREADEEPCGGEWRAAYSQPVHGRGGLAQPMPLLH